MVDQEEELHIIKFLQEVVILLQLVHHKEMAVEAQ
jgi:hypothetical protein